MSAINFVVRDSAGNTSRGSVAGEGVPTSLIVGAGADVSLNISSGQIVSYTRQGQALEITLIDGRTILIEGFFTMEGVTENQLFLSADGYLSEVQLTAGAGADYFASYVGDGDAVGKYTLNDDLYFARSSDVMLPESFDAADDEVGMLAGFAGLAPLLGLGGAGVAAVGAAAIIGGGGGDGGGTTPAAPVIDVTDGTQSNNHVVNQEDHANGVDIAGTGTPGGTVTVVVDGTTETTVVDENGDWTVIFDPEDVVGGERETEVEVTIVTGGGTTTVTDTLVLDTIIDVDMNAVGGDDGVINAVEFDDGITLSGTVTGGDTVVVTIDDVDYTAVVADGAWSLDVPTSVMGDGEYTKQIIVTATDAAGNSEATTSTVIVDTVASVSVNATGGSDGVINAAEFDGGITLSGSATGSDTVVVTIDGVDYNAVVADNSWTLDVPVSVMGAGEYTKDILVTATDGAGNTDTATSTVVVDTITSVSMNATGGSDGVINANEYSGGVTLSGAVVGAQTVVVAIDGVNYNAVVTGGTWSLDVATSVMGQGEYTKTATVTATDAAGNTDMTTASVVVDTSTLVTLDTSGAGGADGVVNFVEQPNGFILTGTAQSGATVVVTMGNATFTTVAVNGAWSWNVPRSDIPTGEETLNVSVVATDAAGNTGTASGTIAIDTFVNELELTGNTAGGADSVVNFNERGEAITLTGTVEAGSTVRVSLRGVERDASVDASGTWSVTYPGGTLPGGEYDAPLVITARDAAGNTTSITEQVRVDTVVGDLTLSSDPIEGNDIVNMIEASNGVTIKGTATPGLIVTVGFGQASLDVVAKADGSWSVDFPANMVPADTASAPITASITDAAGNFKDVSDTVVIDTVVTPFNFSSSAIAGNNIINADEAKSGVEFSGQVEPGSSVAVEFGGQTLTAVTTASGQWSVTFPASSIRIDEYTATVRATATDKNDNVSPTISRSFEVDTLVTTLTTTDPVEGDNIVNAAEAADGITLNGTVEAGSSIVVTFTHPGGVITRDATVDAAGNWSITYAGADVPRGEYDAQITIAATDANDNTRELSDTFRVDTVAPDTPGIEFVTIGTGGVRAVEIDDATNDFTVNQISETGRVTRLADQDDSVDLGSTELFTFNPLLPNGSHLVINETDTAGNSNSTYVVMEEARTDVVDLQGLSQFNVGAIDLSFAKDSELTLDLSTLEGLSDNDNNLIIHGGDDDLVNIAGAVKTTQTTTIGNNKYDIYSMGDDAQLFIDEDITVNF